MPISTLSFCQRVLAIILVAFIYLPLSYSQTVVVGNGNSITSGTIASPVNTYYESLHQQIVYPAADLIAAGLGSGFIAQLGFRVEAASTLAMPNYTISMKHTAATNASVYDAGPLQIVYTDSSYLATSGGFDLLLLDTLFYWDGTSSLLIDVCYDQIGQWISGGTVYYDLYPSSGNFGRSDVTDMCGVSLSNPFDIRPQIQLTVIPVQWNIGVTQFYMPEDSCYLGSSEAVGLIVRNYGSDTVFTYNAYYMLAGLSPDTLVVNDTLPPSAHDTVLFTSTVDLSDHRVYELTGYVNLIGDTLAANDTLSYRFTHYEDFSVSDTSLAYGGVFVGAVADDSVWIYANPCDSLFVQNIVATGSNWTPSFSSISLAPGDSGLLVISFSPDSVINYADSLSILTSQGSAFVLLSGQGLPAPMMQVVPDSFNFVFNGCDLALDTSLIISNLGTTPLQWSSTIVGSTSIAEDFESGGLASGWDLPNSAGYSFTNVCGLAAGNFALYFNGSGSRFVTTAPLNVSTGMVSFNLFISDNNCGDNAESAEFITFEYSTNGGQTWTLINTYDVDSYWQFPMVQEPIPANAVGQATQFRWIQNVFSGPSFDHWALDDIYFPQVNHLTISQDSGSLSFQMSDTIDIHLDTYGLLNGSYQSTILIQSNDPLASAVSVPISFVINGLAQLTLSDTCLAFDTVMQYVAELDSIRLWNGGCDTFVIQQVNVTDTNYHATYPATFILPGDSLDLSISFSPDSIRAYPALMMIHSNLGIDTICLSGYGTGSPLISLIPDSLHIQLTSCNDSVKVPLYLQNIGNADLVYQVDNFGHLNTLLFDDFEAGNFNNWVSGGGTFTRTVTSTNPGSGNFSFQQSGGSSSHYTGVIQNFTPSQPSYVSFMVKSGSTTSADAYFVLGDGSNFSSGTAFFYARNDGMMGLAGSPNYFVPYSANVWYHVEYRNIDFTTFTFDFYIDGQLLYQGYPFRNNDLQVSQVHLYNFHNSTAYYDDIIIGDQPATGASWLEVLPDSGTVSAGATDSLSVCVRSNGLQNGIYQASLCVESNDPLTPSMCIPVVLNLMGLPEISLQDTCARFDSTQERGSSQRLFAIHNSGCDTLRIDSLAIQTAHFQADTNAFWVLPGDTFQLGLTFLPDSIGPFGDTLQLLGNFGDTTLCLLGIGVGAPRIAFQPDSIDVILNDCGDSTTVPITIYNTGQAKLIVNASSGNGQASVSDTIRVLALTYGVDLGREYPNTLAAINQYFTRYILTELNTTDSTTLRQALQGKEVLLLAENESGLNSVFANLGKVMRDFAADGGSIVACGESGFDNIYNAGLFTGNFIGSQSAGLTTIVDPTHPTVDQLSSVGMYSATFYMNCTNVDYQPLLTYQVGINTYDVSGYRDIGSGRAVFIGHDFFNYGNDVARYIANTIEWAGNLSLKTSWLVPSPDSLCIASGDSAILLAKIYSQGLVTGTYTSTLTLTNNTPDSSLLSIPVSLEIAGQAALFLSDTLLAFDSLLIGASQIDTVWVTNNGCDTLTLDSTSFSGSDFQLVNAASSISPGDSAALSILFAPQMVASYQDSLFLYYNGNKDTLVLLTGVGLDAPRVAFSPDTICLTIVGCDNTKDTTFTLYNTGTAPLYWTSLSSASFEDDFDPIINGAQWSGIINGMPNNSCGTGNGANALYFSGYGVREAVTIPLNVSGGGDIGFSLKIAAADNGACEEADFGEDVLLAYSINGGANWVPIQSFHTDSFPSFRSVTLPIPVAAQSAQTMFKWSQPNHSGSFYDNWALDQVDIGINSPGFVKTQPDSSTIAVADSQLVTATFSSKNLVDSTYHSAIQISSNDPNSPTLIPYKLTVIGEPIISFVDTVWDLGTEIVSQTTTASFPIYNSGCKFLTLDSLSAKSTVFTVNGVSIVGDTAFVSISFTPDSNLVYRDSLVITYDLGDTVIYLTGIGCQAPPAINPTGTFYLCDGFGFPFNANLTPGMQWSTGATTDSIIATMPGDYYVVVSDTNGCSDTSAVATLLPDVAAYISVNSGFLSVCSGDQATLVAQNATSSLWSTGSTSNIIVVAPTTTTTYYLTATTVNGCVHQDSVTITVLPPAPPSMVSGMLPTDGTINLSPPINFSWFPAANAAGYDLYIWETGTTRPVNPVASNLTQITYTFNGSLNYGTMYNWQLVAKNTCFTTDGPVQTFSLRQLPDLVVTTVTPQTNAFSGQSFSVNWEITNSGSGSTLGGQWTDRVYLSIDNLFDPGIDQFLGNRSNLTALAIGQSYQQTATFTLPQGISGTFYIFIVTDGYSQLLESDDTNNTSAAAAFNVTLTPPPDLQVTSILKPSSAFSGQPITVLWTVENEGTGGTLVGAWHDRIYLSQNIAYNPSLSTLLGSSYYNGGPLDPDSSYTKNQTVTLPQGIFGRYYIHVVTDVHDRVFEYALENNNDLTSDSMTVFLTPPVDLVVPTVSTVAIADNREQITVQWTVQNIGGSVTPQSRWSDRVYLTTAADSNLTGAINLGTFSRNGVLSPGGSYTTQRTITVPASINGPYYVYVKTDIYNGVYEYIFDGNNVGRSASLVVQSPDLSVPTVTLPASGLSGQGLLVQWSVRNNGPADLINVGWNDRIYLSSTATFNASTALALGNLSGTGNIPAGNSLGRQRTVTLPNGLSGTYYIFIVTDYNNQVFEHVNEGNNVSSAAAIPIALAPWPDLTADQIQLPDSATAGDTIPFTFYLKNVGSASTYGNTWKDRLCITVDSIWNPAKAVPLQTLQGGQLLPAGDSLQISVNLTLPMLSLLVAGLDSNSYVYIWVKTDIDDDVYEHTGENNNLTRSPGIHVTCPPPVDLEVLSGFTSPGPLLAGQVSSFTWSVKNIGSTTAFWNYQLWYDGLFLSQDSIWDPSDIFVTDYVVAGPLDNGVQYDSTASFQIPNGIQGTYCLLLVADHTNLNRDGDRTNNVWMLTDSVGGSLQVPITQPPYPDLVIDEFNTPSAGVAGQPIEVIWTVENKGPGPTTVGSWTDHFYLSTDFVIDAGDAVIGSKVYTGKLDSAETYKDTLQAFLPINASGNYIVLVKTDVNDVVYEHQKELNNTAFAFITVTVPPPSDLIVSSIVVPDSAEAGSTTNIQWIIENIGSNPATGYMEEALYFSLDTIWDVSDILFGVKTGNVNIPPGNSLARNLTAQVSGVSPTDYHVIVRTDVRNNLFEIDDSNNEAASEDSVLITIPELPLNVWLPEVLVDNIELYYRIEIPDSLENESLIVTLLGDSVNGFNELFLRHGDVPSRVLNDFSSLNPFMGNQQIVVPSLVKGTYYLMALGQTTAGNMQNILLNARIMPFSIRKVDADQGGNTGSVTTRIDGSKFATSTDFILQDSTGALLFANTVYFVNPTQVFATFNLAGAALGVYDVLGVNINGDTARLVDGFEVITGSVGSGGGFGGGGSSGNNGFTCTIQNIGYSQNISTNINHPQNTRLNRVVPITIYFENTGNIDIPSPTRILISLRGAPLAFDPADLKQNAQQLLIEFEEPNGPPGILRPGARGSVTVFSFSSHPLSFILLD